MAILRFRIFWEDDEAVYRDIAIKHSDNFKSLHDAILLAYEFDNKHKATFYRSNDHWQRGKEITLEKYDKEYKAEPLLMAETIIGSEIKIPSEKFIYEYDFNKLWTFLVELINISKDENPKTTYPAIVRKEGLAPSQYGTKGLLGDKFAAMEEKYDLSKTTMNEDGFSMEGDEEEQEEEEDLSDELPL